MFADVQDGNPESVRVFVGVQGGKLNVRHVFVGVQGGKLESVGVLAGLQGGKRKSVGVFVPVQGVAPDFIHGFAGLREVLRISGEGFVRINYQEHKKEAGTPSVS